MAKIYENIEMAPDKLIGRIDPEGKIYDEEDGESLYLGWVDYEHGRVFDEEDGTMGWVEDNGEIYGSYEDGDLLLGYVGDEGKLYLYDEDDEIYVGQVTEMTHMADAAAAVLFFFDEFEEIEEI